MTNVTNLKGKPEIRIIYYLYNLIVKKKWRAGMGMGMGMGCDLPKVTKRRLLRRPKERSDALQCQALTLGALLSFSVK